MAGEEERRKAHEALEAQEAELARYAEQVAADQQQTAALQAKIKAMEEKARAPYLLFVLHRVCILTTDTIKGMRDKAKLTCRLSLQSDPVMDMEAMQAPPPHPTPPLPSAIILA